MNPFEELRISVKKCRSFCPWTKEQTVLSFAEAMLNEAEEAVAAARKKDVKNLREEIGDVIWDAIMTAYIAEENGFFTVDDVMKEVVEKMHRRKPFVFSGRQVTLEEAKRLFADAKRKEKLIRIELPSDLEGFRKTQ